MTQHTQSPETQRLGARAKSAAANFGWRHAAEIWNIRGPDGQPSPGLAYRLAHGYEPVRIETRIRLGLPPICQECHKKIKQDPPDWVLTATENLRILRDRFEKARKEQQP